MTRRHPRRRPDLILGPMPVEIINLTIGLELEPGDLIFSRGAQYHAAKEHPEDFSRCLPHLASIVLAPLYIGDDHRNPGKIELIGRIHAVNSRVLIAVTIEVDESGRYIVCSFYPISDNKADGRRQKGFLKNAIKGRGP